MRLSLPTSFYDSMIKIKYTLVVTFCEELSRIISLPRPRGPELGVSTFYIALRSSTFFPDLETTLLMLTDVVHEIFEIFGL